MVKRTLALVVSLGFLLFLIPSFAQMSNEEFFAQMDILKDKMAQVKRDYINTKNEVRKSAMESISKLGDTPEDKEARKKILEEAKKKQAELRDAYKKAMEQIKAQKKELKAARKELKEAAKETERGVEKTNKGLEKGHGKGKK